ncbi:hypothetical protein KCP77_03400 [Salmonella enterica subsp. enterica]|nr:hypothetical protein KCP77_03400 [Salmonella enterica subsp. enterica]
MLGVSGRRNHLPGIRSTVDGRHFVTYTCSRLLLKIWNSMTSLTVMINGTEAGHGRAI